MLFPIGWPGPFGLVMIEALACDTPVSAWRRGSVPEVNADGVTGFVVESVEEAVEAVGRVAGLSRHACREVFEERVDAARMVLDNVDVYRRLVMADKNGRSAPSCPRPAGARDAARPRPTQGSCSPAPLLVSWPASDSMTEDARPNGG